MRISGVRTTSLMDGVGINFVIFFQGCKHYCKDCHNPESWDFKGGYEVTLRDLINAIKPYLGFIDGVTFSGGDPVYQIDSVISLAEWCKSQNLKTTLYTGFYLNEVKELAVPEQLELFDYIIDGRFEVDKKTDNLPFRGSYNQTMYERAGHEWIIVRS